MSWTEEEMLGLYVYMLYMEGVGLRTWSQQSTVIKKSLQHYKRQLKKSG